MFVRLNTFSGLPLEVDRFLYATSIAPSFSRVDRKRLALRLVMPRRYASSWAEISLPGEASKAESTLLTVIGDRLDFTLR